MKWETRSRGVNCDTGTPPNGQICRARVVGGWLVVFAANGGGPTFVPDPTWDWDWSKDEP